MRKPTKKAIYARYGIEYDPKTSKILSPLGWIKPLLKKGNSKTGEKVLTWSMTQATCKSICPGCYASYGFYCMPSVKRSLETNTELARHHMDFVERAIRAQLETMPKGTEVRIHAVGDFFCIEYVEMWAGIVRDFPEIYFWTYTKTEYASAFDAYENGNIVKSVIPGKGYNFGHCAHVMELYRDLRQAGKSVHICKCGVDDNQHCEGCHKCSISEYVLFLEHSTGYDAKKDPLYSAVVEMVNNQ